MLYYYFMYFIIYSFIGWIYESTFRTITHKKIINSGFLNGPLIPIYGFGATSIVLLFYNDNLSFIPLFLSSMVVTTILEYITSYLMEKIFNARWWDYSDKPFNINGRVYLLGALVFGSFSVIVINYVHPHIINLVSKISMNSIYIISASMFIILLYDFSYTTINLLNLDKKIKKLELKIQTFTGKDIISPSDLKEYLKYKISSDLEDHKSVMSSADKHKAQIKRLIKTFPKLSFNRNKHIWEALKEKLDNKD